MIEQLKSPADLLTDAIGKHLFAPDAQSSSNSVYIDCLWPWVHNLMYRPIALVYKEVIRACYFISYETCLLSNIQNNRTILYNSTVRDPCASVEQ